MTSEKSKYQRWYDELILSRGLRDTPIAYTEVHHILPRALGGSDDDFNLVRLTYREHFVAHWLLTKFLLKKDLRKMQFALFAMTMCANGTRIVAGWQYAVARRALITEEMVARAEAKARAEHIDRNHAYVMEAGRIKLKAALELIAPLPLVSKWTPVVKFPDEQSGESEVRRPRRRRRPRPGRRWRTANRVAVLAS